jgi:tRNA(Arg) A34 adenosine deaminase TadA
MSWSHDVAAHEHHQRGAIRVAREARDAGNHPFGALLVVDDVEIARAGNTVVTQRDPTRHAEMNVLQAIAGLSLSERLSRVVLYASTEPCVMCSGAIYWAGIQRVVYGCPTETLARFAGGSLSIPCREVFARGKRVVEVLGPLLEDEAAEVHQGFWR